MWYKGLLERNPVFSFYKYFMFELTIVLNSNSDLCIEYNMIGINRSSSKFFVFKLDDILKI